jgi:hypothetical protein
MKTRSFPLLGALLIFSALPAGAAEFVVSTTSDTGGGSLRAAILAANASAGDDTITFSIPGGSLIVLDADPLPVTSTGRITISAENRDEPIEVSAFGSGRLFVVSAGAGLELVDLILSEGFAPSGTDGNDGAPPTNGTDGENGGAILSRGSVILRRCTIQQCFAGAGGEGGDKTGVGAGVSGDGGTGGSGGAIASLGTGASLYAEDCLFRQNNAGNGGPAGSIISGALGTPGNGGTGGAGGAIFVEDSPVELVRCQFESNRSGGGGTGGPEENAATGGPGGAGGDGGGLALINGTIRLTDCSFRSNNASNGGTGGDAFSNSADTRGPGGRGGHGGGLFVNGFAASATAHVSGCLFDANSAGNGASGGDSPLASSMAGTAGGDGGSGGGLYVIGNPGDPVWRMENSTVHRNFAGIGGNGGDGPNGGASGAGGDSGNGGGIAFFRNGSDYTASLVHVTVISNEDGSAGQEGSAFGGGVSGGDGIDGSGGGIWEIPGGIDSAPGITLANSVVAANVATSVANIGTFAAAGDNFTLGNPGLGALSENGGPTRTVPPVPGSPLIDAGAVLGAPLTVDQRGIARPFNGAPDLGAYEATLQPDLRVGRTSNPLTHLIDGSYSATGTGQSLNLTVSGRKTTKAFLSVENDGDIDDDLALTTTRANRTLRVAVFLLTGGKQNITARLATGQTFADAAPGEVSLVQLDVKARSPRVRANQTLAHTLRSSLPGFLDVARTRVTQAR